MNNYITNHTRFLIVKLFVVHHTKLGEFALVTKIFSYTFNGFIGIELTRDFLEFDL